MAELSARYAAALFELSQENDRLDETLEQAEYVRATLDTDECRRFMEHPLISHMEKREFLHGVFGDKVSEDILGLLTLAVEKNRENFIVSALTEFISMGNLLRRRTTATVVSASLLDEAQVRTLKELLSRKLNKEVELSVKTDSSLIGGLTIHIDGYLIDQSIRKQLSDMRDGVIRGSGG